MATDRPLASLADVATWQTTRQTQTSSNCDGGNLQSSQREIKQNDKEGKEDKWQFLHLLLHRDMAKYTTNTNIILVLRRRKPTVQAARNKTKRQGRRTSGSFSTFCSTTWTIDRFKSHDPLTDPSIRTVRVQQSRPLALHACSDLVPALYCLYCSQWLLHAVVKSTGYATLRWLRT